MASHGPTRMESSANDEVSSHDASMELKLLLSSPLISVVLEEGLAMPWILDLYQAEFIK
jgi:hypothetical protein